MREAQVVTASAAGTERIAEAIAASLEPGDVVLVEGEVGTGKTTFVRAACRALGVAGNVSSPSFTVAQRYEGRVPVSHLDLFRLDSLASEDPALLTDYLDPGTITFVEWPTAEVAALGLHERQREAATVRLEHLGGDARRLSLAGRADLVSRVPDS